jgi:GxxExxY protein
VLHEEITGPIIGAFYDVYNTLGFGFLERVYENSLAYLLVQRGLRVHQQAPLSVFFHGVCVGEYFADLVVEDKVIVELKTVERLIPEHTAQLHNYLKASSLEVGLLLNFGRQATYKRLILTNERKALPIGIAHS